MVGYIAGSDVPVSMRRNKDGKIQLATENAKDAPALSQVISGGFEAPLIFTIEDSLPEREMSRFLCKMAIETFAESFCQDAHALESLVDAPYLDNIREYARHGMNFKGWPYSHRRIFPAETLMRHPETNEWVQAGFGCCLFMNKHRETLFAFLLYGVEFVVNVGGPSLAGYNEWLEEHDGISPMIERNGCRLTIEGEGKSARYYLHGDFNVKAGMEFDERQGYHQFFREQ